MATLCGIVGGEEIKFSINFWYWSFYLKSCLAPNVAETVEGSCWFHRQTATSTEEHFHNLLQALHSLFRIRPHSPLCWIHFIPEMDWPRIGILPLAGCCDHIRRYRHIISYEGRALFKTKSFIQIHRICVGICMVYLFFTIVARQCDSCRDNG